MSTTTRTHGRCAVDQCTNPDRTAAIKAHAGRWFLVRGNVWEHERRTFVGVSWAEACQEHRDTVAAAVQEDVHASPDRWEVQVRTLDYGDAEACDVERVAHGIGTAAEEDGRLF